jgi:hypothetical protein
MNAYRWSRGTAPLILNLASFKPRPEKYAMRGSQNRSIEMLLHLPEFEPRVVQRVA